MSPTKKVSDPPRIERGQRYECRGRVIEVVSVTHGQASSAVGVWVKNVESGRRWRTTRGTLTRDYTYVPPNEDT